MKKYWVLIFVTVICLCFGSLTFAAEDADAGALPAPAEDTDAIDARAADALSVSVDELDPADLSDLVENVIYVLAEQYKESYLEMGLDQAVSLDIRSTRVICIKDELDESQEEFIRSMQEKYFGDVRYIIEFMLYEDYITGGIYSYPTSEEVIVHDDGSLEWTSGYLNKYRGVTFSVDYSTIIEQVIDLHDQFNQVIRFQGEEIIFEK